jgi:hypothetical protein
MLKLVLVRTLAKAATIILNCLMFLPKCQIHHYFFVKSNLEFYAENGRGVFCPSVCPYYKQKHGVFHGVFGPSVHLPHKHGVFRPSVDLPHMGYSVRGPNTPHIISKNMETWGIWSFRTFTPQKVFRPSVHFAPCPHILPHKHGVFGPSIHFTPHYKLKTWGIPSADHLPHLGYLVCPHILPHIVYILPHKHGVFGPSAHFTPLYKQKHKQKHGVLGPRTKNPTYYKQKHGRDS